MAVLETVLPGALPALRCAIRQQLPTQTPLGPAAIAVTPPTPPTASIVSILAPESASNLVTLVPTVPPPPTATSVTPPCTATPMGFPPVGTRRMSSVRGSTRQRLESRKLVIQ